MQLQVTYSFANESELKTFVDRVAHLPAITSASAAATPAAATPPAPTAAPATEAAKRGPGRPPKAAAPGVTHTRAEVNAALMQVKDTLGTPAAKEIVAALGFQRMNDISEDKFDAAYDAAQAALAAGAAPPPVAADDDI